jgi:hypothetical protein
MKRYGTLIALAVVALIVAVGLVCFTPLGVYFWVYVRPTISDFVNRRPFSATLWQKEGVMGAGDLRLHMVDDLLGRVRFEGMSRQQVEALLGKPDMGDTTSLTYRLGNERGGFAVDSEWLTLTLDANGKVRKVEVWRD